MHFRLLTETVDYSTSSKFQGAEMRQNELLAHPTTPPLQVEMLTTACVKLDNEDNLELKATITGVQNGNNRSRASLLRYSSGNSFCGFLKFE
jgi:hypothetical protein